MAVAEMQPPVGEAAEPAVARARLERWARRGVVAPARRARPALRAVRARRAGQGGPGEAVAVGEAPVVRRGQVAWEAGCARRVAGSRIGATGAATTAAVWVPASRGRRTVFRRRASSAGATAGSTET